MACEYLNNVFTDLRQIKFPRFSDILWIDASSNMTIELALMQIAQDKNAPNEAKKPSESVLKWIALQRNNWLMVYDGADGDYQIVEKFLLPGGGGNIVITSRNVGLKRISLKSQKVVNMTEEEATSLLLKSAALDGMSDHNGLVRKLVSELGGIPLALDQAGAYMLTTECGIANYLELFAKHKHALMSNFEFQGASNYDRTTYGTWDMSMETIEKMATNDTGQKALAAQSAIQILRIFAFLDHANIPLELFKNAAENYMKRDVDEVEAHSNHPLDHKTLFLNNDGIWEEMKFLTGIQVLISFSLIEAHSQLYSMHLLVHSWSRNRIPKSEVINVYQNTRALLSCSIVDSLRNLSIDNYAFCRLIAPHIKTNTLHASELKFNIIYYDDEYERFSLVFHHIGSWCYNMVRTPTLCKPDTSDRPYLFSLSTYLI
jgi:hypothetical protein